MLNEKLIEELEKYNQTHLIDTYNTLENTRKENFANQLDSLEFSLLDKLKVFKENNASACKGVIEPLQAMQLKDIDESRSEFRKIGLDAIKAGKVGAVLLAGGQGTRLGFDKPKGMFNIGINKQVFIFQRLIENLMDVVKEAGLFIPLMIMTSEKNNEDTVNFFKENNYFGYNKEKINFFIQGELPLTTFDGRLLIDKKYSVGYMPQRSYAFAMSVEKNIALGGDDKDRAAKLMERLKITHLAKKKANRLSGGETARMALARVLMKSYDVLILDEPTAAMDIELSSVSEDMMREYCQEKGCAMILITHSLQQAKRVADKVLFFYKGTLLEQGAKEQVLYAPQCAETKRFLDFYGV